MKIVSPPYDLILRYTEELLKVFIRWSNVPRYNFILIFCCPPASAALNFGLCPISLEAPRWRKAIIFGFIVAVPVGRINYCQVEFLIFHSAHCIEAIHVIRYVHFSSPSSVEYPATLLAFRKSFGLAIYRFGRPGGTWHSRRIQGLESAFHVSSACPSSSSVASGISRIPKTT